MVHTYTKAGTYNIQVQFINAKLIRFVLGIYLISITGKFNGCENVTDFSACFGYCDSLTSIPEGLFDSCPNVTSFSYCFYDCPSLTSIPEGLFDSCPNVTNFSACFHDCAALQGIAPEIWLRETVRYFATCFRNCRGLDNYYDIPTGWK